MGERQKTSVRLFGFPLAIVIGVLSGVAQAGSGVWTTAGPYGGPVNALAIDPSNPSTLYAGTRAGVFKSVDAAGTWSAASAGLTDLNIQALAIDPSTSSTLYAGTFGGRVFKSTDSGGSWAAASKGLPTTEGADVLALTIDSANPRTLYAATGRGLFKSTDGAGTWADTNLTPGLATALAINPVTPSTLYAGTGDGPYKSTDAGRTWTRLNYWSVNSLVIDPTRPSTIYEGSYSDGVFSSTDAGTTWAAMTTGLPTYPGDSNFYPVILAIDTTMPSRLYAGTNGGGIFRSTDFYGQWWVKASQGLTNLNVLSVAIDPSTPSTLYTGTGGGIFKSVDSGWTWAAASNGLTMTSIDVRALAIHPTNPSTLYVGTDGSGIYRSRDSGATWVTADTGLTDLHVQALAVSPTSPPTVFAGTYSSGLLRSTDGGGTWAQTGLTSGGRALAISPLSPSTLYAAAGPGVVKSIDGGATWSTSFETYAIIGLATGPSAPSTVFAWAYYSAAQTYYRALFKSTNSGGSWTDLSTRLPTQGVVGPVAIDPVSPSTLYAGGYSLIKSTDGGESWEFANAGLSDGVLSVAIDPSTPSTVYVGTFSEGIFRSTDAGETWTPLNTGLPWTPGHMPPVSALVVNPLTKTVSAGFIRGSVWQLTPSAVASYPVTVPVVTSAAGQHGSFFTSELTLTNRGSTDVSMTYTYTSALGGSSGTGSDTLPAGTQKILPDAIEYLRGLGIPVGDSGSRRGTLRIDFSEPASATMRTTTAVPGGRAGLAYAGLPAWKLLSAPVYLCGLRQNVYDRSNVAVLNAGTALDGPITLRLTVISGDPAQPQTQVLPDITLPPGGFSQVNGILASNGLSLTNAYVKVEEVAGNAPFYAYGAINDQANSDGSFVEPIPVDEILSPPMLTLPAIVETPLFSSELVLTNLSQVSDPRTLHCVYSASGLTGGQAAFDITLLPGEQQILPAILQVLRDRGVLHDPPGRTFAGALFVTGSGGYTGDLSVAARTSTPGDGGRYGAYYPAVPAGSEATTTAWLYDFQQDAGNRTNLALVNVGSVDDSTDTFRIDLFDGATGQKAGTAENVTIPAKGFLQLNAVLSRYAPSVSNGYALVTRTSGNNPFIAYAVINDGGEPGIGSGDGAFIGADVPP